MALTNQALLRVLGTPSIEKTVTAFRWWLVVGNNELTAVPFTIGNMDGSGHAEVMFNVVGVLHPKGNNDPNVMHVTLQIAPLSNVRIHGPRWSGVVNFRNPKGSVISLESAEPAVKKVIRKPLAFSPQPDQIDSSHLFNGLFASGDQREAARWLVKFCQSRLKGWAPFALGEVESYFNHAGHSGFSLCGLDTDGFLSDEDGRYWFTEEFVRACKKS